jgi:hypothetical protein
VDVALATIRRFAERSGAERVVVLLDRGDEDAAMVEWEPGGLRVQVGESVGRTVAPEEHAAVDALPVEPPRPVPAPAITVDAEAGEVAAPIGALERMAAAALDLAVALGGRTVAVLDVATADGTLTIAAREGEPVVLALGDAQFTLPEPP